MNRCDQLSIPTKNDTNTNENTNSNNSLEIVRSQVLVVCAHTAATEIPAIAPVFNFFEPPLVVVAASVVVNAAVVVDAAVAAIVVVLPMVVPMKVDTVANESTLGGDD